MDRDVNKGDVQALVLAVLCDGPLHGYAIAREVERRSTNFFKLKEGSLYPALRSLEQQGFIQGAWEIQPNGPARKTYSITKAGTQEYAKRAHAIKEYAAAITSLLRGGSHARTA